MVRALRLALPSILLPIAFAISPAGALAAANTYYAAPGGATSGSACKEESTKPCTVERAVELAGGGDIVVLAPGTYTLKAGGLGIAKEIEIGGAVGAAAVTVLDTTGGNVHVNTVSKPLLHDMRIEGPNGLVQSSGVAERLFVSYTGTSSSGCSLGAGVTMSDSVCWAHDGGASTNALQASASGVKGTVTLRNVTAIAAGSGAAGIYAEGTGGGGLTLDGRNVIARGNHHSDIVAILNGGGISSTVNLTHSSYETVEQVPPATTVTDPATNGNQTPAPVFVDAAAGDFRQALGSPTVDAGVATPEELLGFEGGTRLDLGGGARALGACLGGPPLIDIGAFETPGVDCRPPDNRFRFTRQKLNRKKGTATLTVAIPGPGKLKLTGPGLKTVSLTAGSGGSVKLPVVPVGKARRGLARTGKRKVSPRVDYTPTGGSLYHLAHSMTLRRKVG